MNSKFKVGSRIIAVKSIDSCLELIGRTGTIIESCESDCLCIEFDEPFAEGHNGDDDGSGKPGHCRYIYDSSEIELLKLEKLKSSISKIFTVTTFRAKVAEEEIYCYSDSPYNLKVNTHYILRGYTLLMHGCKIFKVNSIEGV